MVSRDDTPPASGCRPAAGRRGGSRGRRARDAGRATRARGSPRRADARRAPGRLHRACPRGVRAVRTRSGPALSARRARGRPRRDASSTTRSHAWSATTATVHLQSGERTGLRRARARGRRLPVPGLRARRLLRCARTTASAVDAFVADLRVGLAERVAIVVPPGCAWTLPAYELALMVAALAKPRQLTLVTPEREPLSVFGAPAAELARAELDAAGVELLAGVRATVPHPTTVQLLPGASLTCDHVVHLPRLAGPNCRGVPCDEHGFVVVDDAFRVRGTRRSVRRRRRDGRPIQAGRARRPAGGRGRRADRLARGRRASSRAPTVPSCAASCRTARRARATCAPSRPGAPRRPRSPTSASGGPPARSQHAG